jgi:hypothetical protein
MPLSGPWNGTEPWVIAWVTRLNPPRTEGLDGFPLAARWMSRPESLRLTRLSVNVKRLARFLLRRRFRE